MTLLWDPSSTTHDGHKLLISEDEDYLSVFNCDYTTYQGMNDYHFSSQYNG